MSLSTQERDLLLWLLLESRPAYRPYRRCVLDWGVASRGQRGEGHVLLAPANGVVDLEMPLPHVLAYGVVQTSEGDIAVSVRERVSDQLDCDVSILSAGSLPGGHNEIRRWSYSDWSPGLPCPICGKRCRQVPMMTDGATAGVLAVCCEDRRIWVFDSLRQIAIPVPVTRFYTELMRVRNIRSPRIGLEPHRFYSMVPSSTDSELAEAFFHYNKMKQKISSGGLHRPSPRPKDKVRQFVRTLLGKSSS